MSSLVNKINMSTEFTAIPLDTDRVQARYGLTPVLSTPHFVGAGVAVAATVGGTFAAGWQVGQNAAGG